MSVTEVLSAFLLVVAVLVEWIACIGLVRVRNPFNRLHAAAPAAILPPLLVAGAILMSTGLSQAGIKAIVIALVLIITSPITTHAIARAAHNRQEGSRRK